MVHIIVKKDGQRPTSSNGRMAFTPHLNRAIDKDPIFISSHKQYDYELKKRGLTVHDPHAHEGVIESRAKPYKQSNWSRDMIKQARTDSNKPGGYKPSGRFLDELNKKKLLKKHKHHDDAVQDYKEKHCG